MTDTEHKRTVTRQVVADKDGVLQHLREQLGYRRERMTTPKSTRRYKDEARGYVEGLEFAISFIEDWDLDSSFVDPTYKGGE